MRRVSVHVYVTSGNEIDIIRKENGDDALAYIGECLVQFLVPVKSTGVTPRLQFQARLSCRLLLDDFYSMGEGAYNIVGYPVNGQQIDDVLHNVDISDIRPNVVGGFLSDQAIRCILERVCPRADLSVREQQELDLECTS